MIEVEGAASSDVDLVTSGSGYMFLSNDGTYKSNLIILTPNSFDYPVNTDWAVGGALKLANSVADDNNNGLTVCAFDDTTEEGIGFTLFIPDGATHMKFWFYSRPETAPGAARTVGVKLYERGLPSTVDSWSSGTALDDIDITTNENWLEDTYEDTISNFGLTAGNIHQFELTRVSPSAGTNLVDDWFLRELHIQFSKQ